MQRGDVIEIHTAGVADVTTQAEIRGDDYMRLASVAKAFSGAAAVAAVAQGTMTLDDTVSRWRPDLPSVWGPVTLSQLLNHTSGVPTFTTSEAFRDRLVARPLTPVPPRQLVEYVAGEDLEFAPGSRYAYSNTDNILIGLMVEAASDRSYEHELGSRVSSRLGLRQTSLPSGYRLPRPFIHGYDVHPSGGISDDSEIVAAGYTWASGGVVSTPLELVFALEDRHVTISTVVLAGRFVLDHALVSFLGESYPEIGVDWLGAEAN